MSWFRNNQSAMLGIDISTTAIKLVALNRDGGGFSLESYAVVPLPKDAVVDKNICDIELIVQALKTALKLSGIRLKHACVAVSGAAVMSKIITLPASLSEDEIERQIINDADEYIPYPIKDVNFDFEIQGVSANNPQLLDVLLVVSRRENVEERVAALALAGLKTAVVDTELFALERAFILLADQLPDTIKHQTIALLDIGVTTCSLNILYQGKSIYSREQLFSGQPSIEEPTAFINSIKQQIAHLLQFFAISTSSHPIDTVILSGGCAVVDGLKQLLASDLKLPVYIANPFAQLSLSTRINRQALNHDAAKLTMACGLALRGFVDDLH
ncbi:MAG: type IV pilus assembly protein PilM [Methylomonas sp.]